MPPALGTFGIRVPVAFYFVGICLIRRLSMIEVLSRERCVACDACVRACPNEVFESSSRGLVCE